MGQVFNMPAGSPLIPALAADLLASTKDDPAALAQVICILPMNRSRRALEAELLKQSQDQALLLPRIITLGEIEEEEIQLTALGGNSPAALAPILPAINPLKRQMMLSRLIHSFWQQQGEPRALPQSFVIAQNLATLIDQIHTQGLDPEDLQTLAPDHLAGHWQSILEFLKIITHHWPLILQAEGEIDPAHRRDSLIRALAASWQENPPQTRIIIAGSTGSIPAVTALMQVIKHLPAGQIILPSLDGAIKTEDWQNLPAYHPQAGLKKLLNALEIAPQAVMPWPGCLAQSQQTTSRQTLMRNIMQESGRDITPDQLQEAAQDLSLHVLDNEQQEADFIAMTLRHIVEDPSQTAIVITPDRNLARRVIASCQRWDMQIDDSAGEPLSKTPEGLLLRLIMQWVQQPDNPVRFLAMLKHPLCEAKNHKKELWEFEKQILRDKNQIPSLNHILAKIQDENNQTDFLKLIVDICQKAEPLLRQVTDTQMTQAGSSINDINNLIESHLNVFSTVKAHKTADNKLKVIDEITLENTLKTFSKQSDQFGEISLQNYCHILENILSGQTIRTVYGAHPQIQILGAIEARTSTADLIILAGMNEKIWPDDGAIDPWMSQPMRKQFGLPVSEQQISLAAHDFSHYLCYPKVMITRAQMQGGTPAIPSRWLQTLGMLYQDAKLPVNSPEENQYKSWLTALSPLNRITAIERPAPAPPPESRPQSLSISQIDLWLKDPYGLYAQKILRLRPLTNFLNDKDAAIKGDIIHTALETYTHKRQAGAAQITDAHQVTAQLMTIAKQAANQRNLPPALWARWQAGLQSAFYSTACFEKEWQNYAAPYKQEATGEITVKAEKAHLKIKGRADRIDKVNLDANKDHDFSGDSPLQAAIIDYKSSTAFSVSGMKNGALPQLPLEALILSEGGFTDVPAMAIDYLGYWHVVRGDKGGTQTALRADKDDINKVIADTKAQLQTLITIFAEEHTPYLCRPNPYNLPRFSDYAHLARVAEWSAQEGSEAEADTAMEGAA